MRVIKYLGVMLVAVLLWVVVGALLKSLGFGNGAFACVGLVILFVLGPLFSSLLSGNKSNPTDSANSNDSASTTKEKL